MDLPCPHMGSTTNMKHTGIPISYIDTIERTGLLLYKLRLSPIATLNPLPVEANSIGNKVFLRYILLLPSTKYTAIIAVVIRTNPAVLISILRVGVLGKGENLQVGMFYGLIALTWNAIHRKVNIGTLVCLCGGGGPSSMTGRPNRMSGRIAS